MFFVFHHFFIFFLHSFINHHDLHNFFIQTHKFKTNLEKINLKIAKMLNFIKISKQKHYIPKLPNLKKIVIHNLPFLGFELLLVCSFPKHYNKSIQKKLDTELTMLVMNLSYTCYCFIFGLISMLVS
jgi:hypothetical protein